MVATSTEEEQPIDAEQMTEMVKVVESEPAVVNEPLVIELDKIEPIDVKPKKKRASQKTPAVPRAKKEEPMAEPNVNVLSSTINEVVAEVELPTAKVEQQDQKAKTLHKKHE